MAANLILAAIVIACVWLFVDWAMEDARERAEYFRLTKKQIRKAGKNKPERDHEAIGIYCLIGLPFIIFALILILA